MNFQSNKNRIIYFWRVLKFLCFSPTCLVREQLWKPSPFYGFRKSQAFLCCYTAGKKMARFSNSVKNVALRVILISLYSSAGILKPYKNEQIWVALILLFPQIFHIFVQTCFFSLHSLWKVKILAHQPKKFTSKCLIPTYWIVTNDNICL